MSLRLTFRMIAPTAGISLLLLAVGVVSAWRVHALQRSTSHTLQLNVSSMRAAEELEILALEARTRVHQYLLNGHRRSLDQIRLLRPEVERWLAEAVRLATTPHEQALMGRVRRAVEGFFAEVARLSSDPGQAPRGRLEHLANQVLTRDVVEPTHEYLDYNEKVAEKTSQQNRLQARQLAFVLLLLGVCGSGAGLVAGLGLARGVNRSLVQLSVPLRAAAGQLDEVVGPITFAASWDLHELEGVLHRIAERVSAVVERLRQSEREVLRAEQLAAVGQMAAGMAHELRNPLMAMKILVQAGQASDATVGGEASAAATGAAAGGLRGRDLTVLEEEITRLERVLQAFLHFARPPQPERRLVPLQPLVEASVGLIRARADLCDVRITLDLPAEPVVAPVDPGQLRQVLLNLLLNGVDAVPAGGLIHVALLRQREGEVWLRLSDNGCGLPADLGADIFNPFVSTKETGLGLGVSISKRIVELHGGRIEAANVSPAAGGGAVFTVCLPGAAAAAAAGSPRQRQ